MIAQLLEQTASLADSESVRKVIIALATEPSTPRTFSRFARTFDALSRRLREEPELLDEASRAALRQVLTAARSYAASSAPVDQRLTAIELISRASDNRDQDAKWLAKLLVPAQPPAIQQSVVVGLSKFESREVPALLIEAWPSLTPALRALVVETLLSRPAWSSALLEAVRDNVIAEMDLDLVSRQRLLEHSDAALRKSAQLLLGTQTNSKDRQAVVARYREGIGADGNAALGRDVFRKRCIACHRLEDTGNAVGPDLAIYSSKPADALLIALFDPNQSVDPRYQSYTIAFKDGRVQNGMLTEETANGLSLLNAEGKKLSLLRVDIEELRNSGRSLMPEGFEREVTTEDVNHLIAYFRSLRALPKQIAGNTPELVRDTKGGTVLLPARKAEIYGNDITFEPQFKNIGYWHSETDYVRWELELEHAAEFDVWLDWACADSSAGNAYLLQMGSAETKGTVLATGGWDQYRQKNTGRVSLPKGRTEILLRPAAPVRGALFDLRALALVPAGEKPGFPINAPPQAKLPEDPASIARFLLSDANPTPEREALIAKHPLIADKLISVMTAGFAAGTPEEYKRIPWIWRVAIASGKRNQENELREVLRVSAPRPFEPLRDWQAVVIGGGLINGVSQAGDWPQARFDAILKDDKVLEERWDRAIDLAFKMSDDEKVKEGTRYDALRMVAMASWERARPMLEKYLAEGMKPELQMGAVSGLVDVPDPGAAKLLIDAVKYLPERNRDLALEGLMKSQARIMLLFEALESGRIRLEQLGNDRLKSLRNHEDPTIRSRAEALRN